MELTCLFTFPCGSHATRAHEEENVDGIPCVSHSDLSLCAPPLLLISDPSNRSHLSLLLSVHLLFSPLMFSFMFLSSFICSSSLFSHIISLIHLPCSPLLSSIHLLSSVLLPPLFSSHLFISFPPLICSTALVFLLSLLTIYSFPFFFSLQNLFFLLLYCKLLISLPFHLPSQIIISCVHLLLSLLSFYFVTPPHQFTPFFTSSPHTSIHLLSLVPLSLLSVHLFFSPLHLLLASHMFISFPPFICSTPLIFLLSSTPIFSSLISSHLTISSTFFSPSVISSSPFLSLFPAYLICFSPFLCSSYSPIFSYPLSSSPLILSFVHFLSSFLIFISSFISLSSHMLIPFFTPYRLSSALLLLPSLLSSHLLLFLQSVHLLSSHHLLSVPFLPTPPLLSSVCLFSHLPSHLLLLFFHMFSFLLSA